MAIHFTLTPEEKKTVIKAEKKLLNHMVPVIFLGFHLRALTITQKPSVLVHDFNHDQDYASAFRDPVCATVHCLVLLT